jgi:hypothetical protein
MTVLKLAFSLINIGIALLFCVWFALGPVNTISVRQGQGLSATKDIVLAVGGCIVVVSVLAASAMLTWIKWSWLSEPLSVLAAAAPTCLVLAYIAILFLFF